MKHRTFKRFAAALGLAMLTAFAFAGSAMAHPHGGGHMAAGAFHGGGGHVAAGGFRGGAFRGSVGGFHHIAPGGFYRGLPARTWGNPLYHGVPSYRGAPYFRGYHGGWGHPGYWRGLSLGFYVPFLPFGYETLWWGGLPYYYAGGAYYLWDPDASEYVTVTPPPSPADSAGQPADTASAPVADLFVYPKGGQSQEQQAQDRNECRDWAARQSGYDSAGSAANASQSQRDDYLRAQAACLEARGYSVK